MEAAVQLAGKLSQASVRKLWDVYSAFNWPESLPDDTWYMSPELISLHGTEYYEQLSEAQKKKLSFYEVANFFSLVLQGERPLVQGLVDRLYKKSTGLEISEYLHHFVDEENKHMVMFGLFCRKYLGKVYPEKKLTLPRTFAKGEEDVVFFCKALVVEELGDYYNLIMMRDDTIHPLVKELNKVHHVDEARHLAFGRLYLEELFVQHSKAWSAETLAGFRTWLVDYVRSSWGDYYNPTLYKDAGLENSYELRQLAFESGSGKLLRKRASQKLIDLFLRIGILTEEPEL